MKTNRSIMEDMERIQVTDDIKLRADHIYQQLRKSTHRGRRRLQLIFYCLYQAHRELGIAVIPHVLAENVGITPAEMSKAISMFSETQTGYSPPNTVTYPADLLPEMCRENGLSKEAEMDVIQMANYILEKESALLQRTPQIVAAGILYHYMEINGITVTFDSFAHGAKLSQATLKQIVRIISGVDNL